MKREFYRGIRVLIMIAVTLAAFWLMSAPASAQSPLVFGIKPSGASARTPAGASFFTYTLAPGARVDDTLTISNSGGELVILKLYAADGITSINGSTAFAAVEDIRSNTQSWLSTTVSDIPVPPGEEVTVAFQVVVPEDARPGDHVAGWVVEAPPRSGSAGGVGANIIERAGLAVVVSVPGDTVQQLVLGGICLNQETGSNYFEVPVRNEGNVLTSAAGSLRLTEEGGEEVFSRPAEMGNVVPADGTFLRLDAPFDPGPGEYVAELSLQQPDGQMAKARSDIKIGEKKVNGCLAGASRDGGEADGGIPYVGRLPGGSTPWLLIILLVLLMAALLAGREYMVRRRIRAANGE